MDPALLERNGWVGEAVILVRADVWSAVGVGGVCGRGMRKRGEVCR